MRWFVVAGGVVVALIAIVVIVGTLLPRDHVAAMTVRVSATPDTIWSALTAPAEFPAWRSDVTRVELLPASLSGPSWREHSKDGVLTMRTEVAEAPRRLVMRIADKGLPYGGAWEYLIEPDGPAASRVTVIERESVYNPVFRFVSRFIMGHTVTIDRYLRQLGTRFGDNATPSVIAVAAGSRGS